jgi:hypothetical protein
MQQFYFVCDDDDAVSAFAVQVSPVISLELSPIWPKFCPVFPQHMSSACSVSRMVPVAQKLFAYKLFPIMDVVQLENVICI